MNPTLGRRDRLACSNLSAMAGTTVLKRRMWSLFKAGRVTSRACPSAVLRGFPGMDLDKRTSFESNSYDAVSI
jgi:hypothetical protein